MSLFCDQMDTFIEGDLEPEEAELFRAHLPECLKCRASLRDILRLGSTLWEDEARLLSDTIREREGELFDPAARDVRAGGLTGRTPPLHSLDAPRASRGPRFGSRGWAARHARALVAAGGASLLALSLLAVFALGPPGEVVLQRGEAPRPIPYRLSYSGADRHARYAPAAKQGGPALTEDVRRRLDRLQGEEATHAWAAALVLLGDAPEQAARRLNPTHAEALSLASPEVLNDLAVVRLQMVSHKFRGDEPAFVDARKDALECFDRALERRPGFPQALFNRAVVLKELGLSLSAAEAFERVARLGELGWSDEAAAEAKALRADASRWALGGASPGRTERASAVYALAQEVLLRDASAHCQLLAAGRAELALVALDSLGRVQEARDQLERALAADATPPCHGQAIGAVGAYVLADLAQFEVLPDDRRHLDEALDGFRHSGEGSRLLAEGALGRFELARAPERGVEILSNVIRDAEKAAVRGDAEARKARAYSYNALILHDGTGEQYDRAFDRLARLLDVEPPGRCALGVAADIGKKLVLVRDRDGALSGFAEAVHGNPARDAPSSLVPEDMRQRLAGCEEVAVLAVPALHGQVGLLPADIAWSYRIGRPRPLLSGPAVPPVALQRSYRAPKPSARLYEVPSEPADSIRAGAHAVLASTVEVQDPTLDSFFDEFRELIRQGFKPAVALQRTREKWGGGVWVDGLLAFDDGS